MAVAGKKIDDEELIYILASLDFECNSVVSALVARPHAITIGEVYSQLMSYEQCIEQQQHAKNYQASMNASSHAQGNARGWMGLRGGHSGTLHRMLATLMGEATPARLQTQDQNVKCASKGGTLLASAGIDLMTHMSLMIGMLG
jgi:hypothetical protein